MNMVQNNFHCMDKKTHSKHIKICIQIFKLYEGELIMTNVYFGVNCAFKVTVKSKSRILIFYEILQCILQMVYPCTYF